MKHILLLFIVILMGFSASAQYKDSLKTYRKLTKSAQKSSDFVFIPSGTYTSGISDSDGWYFGQNDNYLRSRTTSVDSFFMEKFEVR